MMNQNGISRDAHATSIPNGKPTATTRAKSYIFSSSPYSSSNEDNTPHSPKRSEDLIRPSLKVRSQTVGHEPSVRSGAEDDGSPLGANFWRIGNLSTELMTAALIPLPYLLSGLIKPLEAVIDHSHHPSRVELAEEVLEEVAATALPIPIRALSLIQACALTSVTLVLVGALGRLRARHTSLDRRKNNLHTGEQSPKRASTLSLQTVRRVFLRIVCVGLPYLAVVEIGGVRTGFILLAALASGIVSPQDDTDDSQRENKTWKRALRTRPWICGFLLTSFLVDLVWLRPGAEIASIIRGYVALMKSILFLQPPLPSTSPSTSRLAAGPTTHHNSASTRPLEESPTLWKGMRTTTASPLIHTIQDTSLTLYTGLGLGIFVLILSLGVFTLPQVTIYSSTVFVASVISATALFTSSQPLSIRSPQKYGFALGLFLCSTYGLFQEAEAQYAGVLLFALAFLAFAAVKLDLRLIRKNKKYDTYTHNHHRHGPPIDVSKFTTFMMHTFRGWPLIHGILQDKESRRIVYFMLINLLFMFIQTFYALVSGSLGLLSDSIHMFFDCIGLLAGLVAAVMSKWPPNSRFPYGYGKVETLSGLGNGIFLIIISVEIIWESFERFFEGVELRRINELLVVSLGGLLVNLIGLLFIGHAHHGHGHDHGHSHGHGHNHGHSHNQETLHQHKTSNLDLDISSIASTSHAHSHANENITGIYLHILADTMGSVAVIASTLLTAYTGWSGWDPLASFLIAVLIIAASCPLVAGAAKRLLLTLPADAEYRVRGALQELSGLRGIAGYAVPRFWLDDSGIAGAAHSHGHDHDHEHSHGHSHNHSHDDAHPYETTHAHAHAHAHDDHSPSHSHAHSRSHSPLHDTTHDHDHDHDAPTSPPRILGVIHVIASRGAEPDDVRARVSAFLRGHGIDAVVQVEREGQSGCWCGFQARHSRGVSTVGI